MLLGITVHMSILSNGSIIIPIDILLQIIKQIQQVIKIIIVYFIYFLKYAYGDLCNPYLNRANGSYHAFVNNLAITFAACIPNTPQIFPI